MTPNILKWRPIFKYKRPVWQAARHPQNPNKVPFDPILPLGLKNRVSGKADAQTQVACLYELSLVFAKLKETEFDDKKCTKELEQLRVAHVAAMNKAREDQLKNTGQLMTTGKQLNSRQLNKYLKKFPQMK